MMESPPCALPSTNGPISIRQQLQRAENLASCAHAGQEVLPRIPRALPSSCSSPSHDRRLYAAPRAEMTIDVPRRPGRLPDWARSTRCRRRGSPPIDDFAAMLRSTAQHRHGGAKWEQFTCTSS
jgi:hypothetical protein